MYIQPDSTIQIMRGVPLNTAQRDTLYFDSESEQASYFSNYVRYNFTAQYYQRVNKNTCRLEINAESVYDCNYMRFKNNAFGDKWFYAFITNIEYINHNVTEFTYEIDVLQSWAFQYVLGKCFVEREHSADDIIGSHLLPEPIDSGEPYCQSVVPAGYNEMVIVILEAFDESQGVYMEGVFSGCAVMTYPATVQGAIDADRELRRLMGETGGANNIAGIYMAPAAFATNQNTPETKTITLDRPETIAGFEPNNKKLLTYPYSFLCVDTLNDSHIYRYEYFQGEVPVFEATGCVIGTPSVVIAPVDYELREFTNYTQQVIMGGYPMCSFTIDSYKQWLASSGVYNKISTISSAGSLMMTAATCSGVGMAAAGMGVASAIAHDKVESQRANTSRGAVSNPVNCANRTKDVYFKHMTLKREKAEALDDFFSRYGYTCERVKVPNRNVRKRWTYTKTKGCVVKGNAPADDLAKIASYFDSGITFWNSSTGSVGEYVMNDNEPLGGA